jgi:hypothetical protein
LSDDSALLSRLVDQYGSEKIILADGHIGHVETDPNNSYERAILDNELFSRCDEMILTRYSTFGFVSAMKQHAYRLKSNPDWDMPFFVPSTISKNFSGDHLCERIKLGYVFF